MVTGIILLRYLYIYLYIYIGTPVFDRDPFPIPPPLPVSDPSQPEGDSERCIPVYLAGGREGDDRNVMVMATPDSPGYPDSQREWCAAERVRRLIDRVTLIGDAAHPM